MHLESKSFWNTLHKKWSFPLRILSVNVTKSAVSWWNPHKQLEEILYGNQLILETLSSDKKRTVIIYLKLTHLNSALRWGGGLVLIKKSATNNFLLEEPGSHIQVQGVRILRNKCYLRSESEIVVRVMRNKRK